MRLVDRSAEKQMIRQVLESVRGGMSGALVLRGEPGVGKSALLDYAVEHAADLQVVRIVAVEFETRLGFAAVHRLLLPVLHGLDRLPGPQGRALCVAFGLATGPAADPFLVGLGVLTLLADAAEARPVLCVIDDAQWLDDESAVVLGFVARRLLADRVGMLFAIRETTEPDPRLQALPTLRLEGLPQRDAHELLAAVVDRPVDSEVAERIIAGTGGNPLAMVEAARELTPGQLRGQVPLLEPLPVGHQLEDLFVRRVSELPPDTQTLLLLAAAEQPGRADRMWRAAAALGITESAAGPAEAARFVSLLPEVRFSHPLVRSAVYHSAAPGRCREVHRALAAACDPLLDAVPRAWHLARAATGPDEQLAAYLEETTQRDGGRGGYAAAAALLERAALLTPEQERRSVRQLWAAQAHVFAGSLDRADALLVEARPFLRDPRSTARAIGLEGRIRFHRGHVAEATDALVAAARRLSPLDPRAARDTLLFAVEASVFAGWASCTPLLQEIARTARDLPPSGDPPDAAPDLLLQSWTVRLTGGYGASVPALRRTIPAFLANDVHPDVALRRLGLITISAIDLLDDVAVDRLTRRWIDLARRGGALATLAAALAFRSVFVDGAAGRLGAARAAESEARELAEVTHNPGVVPPTGAHTLLTLALSGRESEARATAAAVADEAPRRGAAGELAMAASFLGVLEISLGNYGAAVECLHPAFADDTPLVGTQALPDLVEAGVRGGRRDLAERAFQRLADRVTATGTPLALGLLARCQALLADQEDARPGYEEAITQLGEARTPLQLARTHLLYGEWLRRRRQRREARDQLRIAHDMFDAMGLHPFAERADVELRATGERARKRELGTPEELTPREAQIAALVGRGEANREIAAQLFLSPSTVEYHLRKVFRKVGVTSRTQLAHRVVHQEVGVGAPTPTTGRPALDVPR